MNTTTNSPWSLRRGAACALLIVGGALALAGCDRRAPEPTTGTGTGSTTGTGTGTTGTAPMPPASAASR
jgi:hypothetical protein